MEKEIDIGSVTLLVNDQVDSLNWVPIERTIGLAESFEKEFKARFSKSSLSNHIKISSIEWERGCLLETISFVYIAYKGIKDYPELREGIITFCRDIKFLYLKVRKGKTKCKIAFWKNELLTQAEIEEKLAKKNKSE